MSYSLPRHGVAGAAFAIATVVFASTAASQTNAAPADTALRGPDALQAAAFDTLLHEVMQDRELRATLARAQRPSVAPICVVVRSPSAMLTPPWGADPSGAVMRATRATTPIIVAASGCPAAPADTGASAKEAMDLVWVEPITRVAPGSTFRAGIITRKGHGPRSTAGRDFRCQTVGPAAPSRDTQSGVVQSGVVQSGVVESSVVQPGDTLPGDAQSGDEQTPPQVRCLADGAWFS